MLIILSIHEIRLILSEVRVKCFLRDAHVCRRLIAFAFNFDCVYQFSLVTYFLSQVVTCQLVKGSWDLEEFFSFDLSSEELLLVGGYRCWDLWLERRRFKQLLRIAWSGLSHFGEGSFRHLVGAIHQPVVLEDTAWHEAELWRINHVFVPHVLVLLWTLFKTFVATKDRTSKWFLPRVYPYVVLKSWRWLALASTVLALKTVLSLSRRLWRLKNSR